MAEQEELLMCEKIIAALVKQGVIPPEHATWAAADLDKELRRRTKRLVRQAAMQATQAVAILS
jgi:hypothetical protein